jgi:hypothetical protein
LLCCFCCRCCLLQGKLAEPAICSAQQHTKTSCHPTRSCLTHSCAVPGEVVDDVLRRKLCFITLICVCLACDAVFLFVVGGIDSCSGYIQCCIVSKAVWLLRAKCHYLLRVRMCSAFVCDAFVWVPYVSRRIASFLVLYGVAVRSCAACLHVCGAALVLLQAAAS